MRIAAAYDSSGNCRVFRAGDTMRGNNHEKRYLVIGSCDNWLWLDPVDSINATPATDRADEPRVGQMQS